MIGICGDNCQFCPRYVATNGGRPEELENVKELWVRLGLRDPDFPAQDLACDGCKRENRCAYSELRACANERAIDNCGLCHDYPCGLIQAAFEKSENLRDHAAIVCRPKEMDTLHKAFFSKKQNLDQIHIDMNQGRKGEKTTNKRLHHIADEVGFR
jgi:hypothetical protein